MKVLKVTKQKKHVFHPKSHGQHEGYKDSQAVKVSFCDGIGFEREDNKKGCEGAELLTCWEDHQLLWEKRTTACKDGFCAINMK